MVRTLTGQSIESEDAADAVAVRSAIDAFEIPGRRSAESGCAMKMRALLTLLLAVGIAGAEEVRASSSVSRFRDRCRVFPHFCRAYGRGNLQRIAGPDNAEKLQLESGVAGDLFQMAERWIISTSPRIRPQGRQHGDEDVALGRRR